MFRPIRHFVVLTALGLFAFTTFAAPRTDHVFIISIDGASPDVMKRAKMPVLMKMAKEGAWTWDARTITPSLTLPSHVSMLTGVVMEKHKITWNDLAMKKGFVDVPTVFSVARPAGFSTAMVVSKEKLVHIAQPGTVDHFSYDQANSKMVLKSTDGRTVKEKEGVVSAKAVAQSAADYIIKHKPQLCFIHFGDPDAVGHEFGWGSPEQLQSLADVDTGLGLVLKAIRKAGLAKRSVVIISADHGGHAKGHSKSTLVDQQIPWIAWGQGVKEKFEIIRPVSTCDTAATALWLLGLETASPLDGVVVRSAFE